MPVTIELPDQKSQINYNLKRWDELGRIEGLGELSSRIETDRHGKIVMSPYASGWHGALGGRFIILFDRYLGGMPVSECPICTSDGVKLADVGWFSPERYAEVSEYAAFPIAPEICVEVLSPSNTRKEMEEKRKLYFEAGCLELWTCTKAGRVSFYTEPVGEAVETSRACPEFPKAISI